MAMCVPKASPSVLPVPAMPETAWKCSAPCPTLQCPAVSSTAQQPAHSWHRCPGGDTEAPHRQAMATRVTPHRNHLCSSTYRQREGTPDSANRAAEKMHSRISSVWATAAMWPAVLSHVATALFSGTH